MQLWQCLKFDASLVGMYVLASRMVDTITGPHVLCGIGLMDALNYVCDKVLHHSSGLASWTSNIVLSFDHLHLLLQHC